MTYKETDQFVVYAPFFILGGFGTILSSDWIGCLDKFAKTEIILNFQYDIQGNGSVCSLRTFFYSWWFWLQMPWYQHILSIKLKHETIGYKRKELSLIFFLNSN